MADNARAIHTPPPPQFPYNFALKNLHTPIVKSRAIAGTECQKVAPLAARLVLTGPGARADSEHASHSSSLSWPTMAGNTTVATARSDDRAIEISAVKAVRFGPGGQPTADYISTSVNGLRGDFSSSCSAWPIRNVCWTNASGVGVNEATSERSSGNSSIWLIG